jgi:hypothetical protein
MGRVGAAGFSPLNCGGIKVSFFFLSLAKGERKKEK